MGLSATRAQGAVRARRNAFGGSRGEEDDVAIHDMKVFTPADDG